MEQQAADRRHPATAISGFQQAAPMIAARVYFYQ
jgi:hypothetical protein